jgi:serine/threonine protein kinase
MSYTESCDCPCLPISLDETLREWNKLRVWPEGSTTSNSLVRPNGKLKVDGGRRKTRRRQRQRGGGFRLVDADIPDLTYFQKNKLISKLQDATVVRHLGAGNFGVVNLIELSNGLQVVKKRMEYPFSNCQMDELVEREIHTLKTLTHNPSTRPYVCNFIGALYYADPTIIEKVLCCKKPTIKIVEIYIQYIEGQSLYQYMNSLLWPEDINVTLTLPKIINGLYNGLNAIHRAGYIHSDIKPDNIFITYQGTPIFIDFGLTVKKNTKRLGGDAAYTPRQYTDKTFPINALPYLDYYALDKSVNIFLTSIRNIYKHVNINDEEESINTQIQSLPIDWAFVGSTFRSLEDGTFDINGPLGLASSPPTPPSTLVANPNGLRRRRASMGTRKKTD